MKPTDEELKAAADAQARVEKRLAPKRFGLTPGKDLNFLPATPRREEPPEWEFPS